MPDRKFRTFDLNLLRVFEALMREGNVTRAAQRLSLTQPAVSNSLSRLRDVFADVLFEKTREGMRPTPRARELWASLQPYYEGLRSAFVPRAFDPRSFSGVMRLAMTDDTAERVVPRLSCALQRHARSLRLETVKYAIGELPRALESGGVDLAIGTYLNDWSECGEIRTHSLERIDYALLMRRGHPLSFGKVGTREMLRARHVDLLLSGMTIGMYDQVLAAHGHKRNLVLTLQSYQAILGVLLNSDCIGLLPRSLLDREPYAQSIVALDAPIPLPPRDLWLIWHQRDETNPMSSWLRTLIVSLFAEKNSDIERPPDEALERAHAVQPAKPRRQSHSA